MTYSLMLVRLVRLKYIEKISGNIIDTFLIACHRREGRERAYTGRDTNLRLSSSL